MRSSTTGISSSKKDHDIGPPRQSLFHGYFDRIVLDYFVIGSHNQNQPRTGPMYKIFLLLITCAVLCAFSPAASAVDVIVSSAVDTTDVDKKAVLQLWTDYLESRPDLMWSDTEWNSDKSRFWRDFDLTAPYVYQFNTDDPLRTYQPTVMAIEKEGELYSIRTLFYGEGLDPTYDNQNLWAIVRVYARYEGDRWKLGSALGVHTAHWNRPAIGKITFVSPPEHDFNVALASRSVSFCDSLSHLFDFFSWDPFEFYITASREEVDRIIGLDYYVAGFPWARAMRPHDILITGKGSEWYPQELVRMIATGPGLAPHNVLEEGFAGWIGGWQNKSYADNMREVAAYVSAHINITFQDYLDRGPEFDVDGSQYFPGAVLCDMVYSAAGAGGIEMLFKAGRTDDALYAAIQQTLGMDRAAFGQAWQDRILRFK
jgi:hypothetical protein